MSKKNRNINQPDYPVKIEFDSEGEVFVAEFLDLPGCSADGPTVEEAYRRAQQVKEEWIKTTLEQGLPVPKPSARDDYSGRILLRLPTSLHSMLADRAKMRGASLNQFIVHLLSGALVGDAIESQLVDLKSHVLGCERHLVNVSQNLKAFPRYANATFTLKVPSSGIVSDAVDDSFGGQSSNAQTQQIVSNIGRPQ